MYGKSRFTVKLSITLIIFSIIISFTVATADHFMLRDQIIHNSQMQVESAIDMTEQSLQKIEKAYYLFDKDEVAKMEESSRFLVDMYKENPNFESWDFKKLKAMLGFEIFIINENNRIIHSTLKEDLGLDFNVCCKKLAPVLHERRASGRFFHDGIDIEMRTGNIKKYSYMGTYDQKYLIELGFLLQNGAIFEEFNFFHAIDEIKKKYPLVYEINILNEAGVPLGQPIETGRLTGQRFAAFAKTYKTQQMSQFEDVWSNKAAAYRYIPYVSDYDHGFSKHKVLEIIYNTQDLQTRIQENTKSFFVRLLLVLVITIALSLVISRWVAKPMYLAFHDSLTGLKNRAAFEEIFPALLAKNKGTIAMLLFDLDNFKSVNDLYGHDKGDLLLIQVAKHIQSISGKANIAFRLGGDEFIMVMPNTSRQSAESMAQATIDSMKETINQTLGKSGEDVTVSIGISLAPEHGVDLEALYKQADIALYVAKKKGKSQYQFFHANNSKAM